MASARCGAESDVGNAKRSRAAGRSAARHPPLRLDDLGDALQFVVTALLDADVPSASRLFRLASHSLNRAIAAAYPELDAVIDLRSCVWSTDDCLQENVELSGSSFRALHATRPCCAAGPVITDGVHMFRLRVTEHGTNLSGSSMNLGVIDATAVPRSLRRPAWAFNPLTGRVRHFTDGTDYNPSVLAQSFYEGANWVRDGATMDVVVDMINRQLSLVLNDREPQVVRDLLLPAAVRVWVRFSCKESVVLSYRKPTAVERNGSAA
jgi:hypothetical protein